VHWISGRWLFRASSLRWVLQEMADGVRIRYAELICVIPIKISFQMQHMKTGRCTRPLYSSAVDQFFQDQTHLAEQFNISKLKFAQRAGDTPAV